MIVSSQKTCKIFWNKFIARAQSLLFVYISLAPFLRFHIIKFISNLLLLHKIPHRNHFGNFLLEETHTQRIRSAWFLPFDVGALELQDLSFSKETSLISWLTLHTICNPYLLFSDFWDQTLWLVICAFSFWTTSSMSAFVSNLIVGSTMSTRLDFVSKVRMLICRCDPYSSTQAASLTVRKPRSLSSSAI